MTKIRSDIQFAMIPAWVLEADISEKALRLYALLSLRCDYETREYSIGRKEIAVLISRKGDPVSLDTVDRLKSELVKSGALSVDKNVSDTYGNGHNTYTVHRIPPETLAARVPPSPTKKDSGAAPGAATQEQELLIQNEELPEVPARTRVRLAWLSAEPLISHRESYFKEESIRRRVDNAVRKYGVEDVCAAIVSYAEVLASEAHFFNHRWTFGDFLQRGLDRFVPESKPQEVFLSERVRTIKGNGSPGSEFAGDLARFDSV